MNLASRFAIAEKALRQLGVEQLGLYAIYQLGIYSGHYQRQLTSSLARLNDLNREPYLNLHPCLSGLPDREAMINLLGDQVGLLYEQGDEVISGKVRLFGGEPVPLVLNPPQPASNWTNYERKGNLIGGQDIKYIWEPGRFGWAYTLAMAYHLSSDERYAEAFWHNCELFLSSNPAYLGLHWSSAQEVAIRIVALAFALQVFIKSRQATPARLDNIAKAIAIHAERIPPTLPYARSQNNNHLITEGLGLYTASALLPEHPLTRKWHELGWKWLQHAFRTQIDQDGTYIQHSTNYHRLMLQAALWAFAVNHSSFINEPIPEDITNRLQASTRWLWKLVDPESGRVPNLGNNDGAYILPLTVCPYHDYRPIIYAAAITFFHSKLVPQGSWCDMSNWLSSTIDTTQTGANFDSGREEKVKNPLTSLTPHILQNPKNGSWAYFRVTRFHSRPAHADQLHLDLWWRGLNLAQDAGTYLYNAPPPWDNSLTSALVHNTVVVDGQEFMQRAGRFLYLDWAQSVIIPSKPSPDESYRYLIAEHNGYRKIGIKHIRTATTYYDGHWEIIDSMTGPANSIRTIRLHWMLPDWEYEILEMADKIRFPAYEICLRSPHGRISLQTSFIPKFRNKQPQQVNFKLARAGVLLVGSGAIFPNAGWTSPTYGIKKPALAYIFEITDALPIVLKSQWILPDET